MSTRANLLLPDDNKTVLNRANFDLGFTQSELGVWDDCAEKWYLGYNHMLERMGTFAWHFVYGDAFHRFVSGWYRGDEMPDFIDIEFNYPPGVILDQTQEMEEHKWMGILAVTLERYAKYYEKDREEWNITCNEETLETTYEGIKLTGKIDLGFELQGCNYLADTKTSGQFNMAIFDGWNFKFQFMFYIWLYQRDRKEHIDKFLVNAVKKPVIRVNKNETIEAYVDRFRQLLIQEPDKYFVRMPLQTIKGSMQHFEERVLKPKVERIRLLTEHTTSDTIIDALVRNQNSNHCNRPGQTCQFLPICKNGFKAEGFQYSQRTNKHQELCDAE